MNAAKLTIDGRTLKVPADTTILQAARQTGIYIPALCHHPDIPPAGGAPAEAVYQGDRKIANHQPQAGDRGCGLCVVEIEGRRGLVNSCNTVVEDGLVVRTGSERVKIARQQNLAPILARHRHACLICAQQAGCSRTQCSAGVPESERCCHQFGRCEFQAVAEYIGIDAAAPKKPPDATPLLDQQPLFVRDYNLCIGCTRCVRACRDLMGIEAIGFVYDAAGLIQVGTLAPTLEESGCKFCTVCVEVCPTGALTDKGVRPGRKVEDLVPCREACPAHIDVPAYLRLVAAGRPGAAAAVVREKVPLPGVLGRVCVHPCEEVCRRAELEGPIAICALKRFAADHGGDGWMTPAAPRTDTPHRVAVVGSGPAGLSAAYYLRRCGHQVTVFEGRPQPGGMLRYGIPAYRLPREVLEREIRDILDQGIELKLNHPIRNGAELLALREGGYGAVFLGVGAQHSRRIALEGADLPQVLWGLEFLEDVARGEAPRLGGRIIVVGGGSVAVDAALTALRCGAQKVVMVCLEDRERMPAHPWELEGALAEGIEILPSWGPLRILQDEGRVGGMELSRCTAVFDEGGDFRPVLDAAATWTIACDWAILAVGQTTDMALLEGVREIAVERGLVVVGAERLETGLAGVFAGGDAVALPGTVIRAVADGRRAAAAIDRALGGEGAIDEVLFERGVPDAYLGREEGFAARPRAAMPEPPPAQRRRSFAEVLRGFEPATAVAEAQRCLQCDLRLHMQSNPWPPQRLLPFSSAGLEEVPVAEGVFRLYDASRKTLAIKGTADLKEALLEELRVNETAAWFDFEAHKLYSKRESELLQRYLQEHGEMPGSGSSELDDLF